MVYLSIKAPVLHAICWMYNVVNMYLEIRNLVYRSMYKLYSSSNYIIRHILIIHLRFFINNSQALVKAVVAHYLVLFKLLFYFV